MADTEGVAVAAVRAVIAGADYLKGYISDNDKGPSLDGYICGYTKKGYKKENESGRAQVQIKGKECKTSDLLQERISYPVEVADLKVFKQMRGAIFFVVLYEKGNTDHKRIYYNPLLPYDINDLLKDKEKQKTVTIYLRPFPKGKEMEDTVLTFIENSRKQSSLISLDGYKNFSLDDIFNSQIPNAQMSFSVGYTSVQHKKPDNNFQYFFSHDFYVYFKSGDLGIPVPAQHVDRLKMVNRIYPCSLCIGDTEYFDKCRVTILKDKTIYGFFSTKTLGYKEKRDLKPDLFTNVVVQETASNGRQAKKIKKAEAARNNSLDVKKFPFVVVMNNEEPDELGRTKASYTYNIIGNLSERINIGSFILELLDKKKYSLNGHESPFNPPEDEIKSFDFEQLRGEVNYWKEIQSALNIVGCTEPLILDGFTDDDEKRLTSFMASVLHKLPLKYDNPMPELVLYPIHNLQLLVFFEKQSNGRYLIKKIPDKEIKCEMETPEGKTYPTSFYCMFTPENFAEISNLDFERVVDSINAYDNDPHLEKANMSMLYMLTAYDETGKDELLSAAMNIAAWLVDKSNPNTLLSLMNFYQCRKRMGTFDEVDRNSVNELMKDQTAPDILAGCYLLLDDSKKAEEQIKHLDEDMKKAFMDYPIIKFMDEKVRAKLR